MYNLYQGTKFYYGGVANKVDSQYEGFSGATGGGWSDILDRAEADIRAYSGPSTKVQLFGFSRGSAVAIELARRLERAGVTVEYMGLFDPVYSRGLPGQASLDVSGTRPFLTYFAKPNLSGMEQLRRGFRVEQCLPRYGALCHERTAAIVSGDQAESHQSLDDHPIDRLARCP